MAIFMASTPISTAARMKWRSEADGCPAPGATLSYTMASTGSPKAWASSTTAPSRRRLCEAVLEEKLVCTETASAPRRTAASTRVSMCFVSGSSSIDRAPLSCTIMP